MLGARGGWRSRGFRGIYERSFDSCVGVSSGEARRTGDRLIVAVNSDLLCAAEAGRQRPRASRRAQVLAAMAAVTR